MLAVTGKGPIAGPECSTSYPDAQGIWPTKWMVLEVFLVEEDAVQSTNRSTDPWVLEQGQIFKGRKLLHFKNSSWDALEPSSRLGQQVCLCDCHMMSWDYVGQPMMSWDYEVHKVIKSSRNRGSSLCDINRTLRIRQSRSRKYTVYQNSWPPLPCDSPLRWYLSFSSHPCYHGGFHTTSFHRGRNSWAWFTDRLAQCVYDDWKWTATINQPTQRWSWQAVEKASFLSSTLNYIPCMQRETS